MKRLSTVATGTILLSWFALAAGCSDSGAVTPGSGGSSSTGATSSTGAAAGTTTAGTGTGTGAAPATTGGSSSSTTGGAPSTGGTSSSGGAGAGAGGTPGTTGGTGGADPVRPAACASADGKGKSCTTAAATCSKTCGPKSVGYKVLTCNGATWDEANCQFPASGNYTCFKRANPLPSCGATPAKASDPCTVADCMPCGPTYLDSTGASKTGACVCNAQAAAPVWSCASDDAWPPQTP